MAGEVATEDDCAAHSESEATRFEDTHARQIFVYGEEGVRRLTRASVLVLGSGGVGAEVAKNLVLSGVQKVTLHDHELTTPSDLCAQFFLRASDVGSSRAEAIVARLRELNESVTIHAASGPVDAELLRCYQAVVATCGTLEELCAIDALCRSCGVAFVSAAARGLLLAVFSDFGAEFHVAAPQGDASATFLVESITRDCPATVTVVDESRHRLETGDAVVFDGCGAGAMLQLDDGRPREVTVTGPYSFTVADDTRTAPATAANASAGYLRTVPAPRTLSFAPLDAALLEPRFAAHDEHGAARMRLLHLTYRALDLFQVRNERLPTATAADDVDALIALAHGLDVAAPPSARVGAETLAAEEGALRLLARSARAELAPVASAAGAVAAQEALKACACSLQPAQQFFYFDAADCHAGGSATEAGATAADAADAGRYASQVALFGRAMQEKLGAQRYLLAGMGAVGAEVLKNWAVMGVGAGAAGAVTLADAEAVQPGNPHRQCLFRAEDAGRARVAAAADAACAYDPALTVHARPAAMAEESAAAFGSDFFLGLTGACTALQRVAPRLFVDEQCVHNQIPMIDTGVQGTMASVQIAVPFQSEPWSATRDPPERDPPTCTLKNFPYKTEHAVKWARELFDTLFHQRPQSVNLYLTQKRFLEELKAKSAGECAATVRMLHESLVRHKIISLEACARWARLQFEEHFANQIKQLLHNFPLDMLTTDGACFWAGTKRAPSPLQFEPDNPLHMGFVHAAANLQAVMYGLKGTISPEMVRDTVLPVEVPEFRPREGVKIVVGDGDGKAGAAAGASRGGGGGDDDEATVAALMEELPTPGDLAGYQLTPLLFDEGHFKQHHLAFVLAASNCRTANYQIPPATRLLCRRVACEDALPAAPPAASLVAALACLEVYKLAWRAPAPRESHRNSFANLALPKLVHAAPVAVQHSNVQTSLGTTLRWSLWDQLTVDGAGGCTLQQFLDKFKAEQGLEVCMLSHGRSMLYAEFLGKRMEARMGLSMVELVETIGKTVIEKGQSHIAFSLGCIDSHGDDVEVPTVNLQIR